MIKLEKIKAWGTEVGSVQSMALDEIVLLATPDTLHALGNFFLCAAQEMTEYNTEHIHLQDRCGNFWTEEHVDIILANKETIKISTK